MKIFESIFRVLCNMALWCYQFVKDPIYTMPVEFQKQQNFMPPWKMSFRLHDAGRIWKQHEKVPFWSPVYTMPVEFEIRMKRCHFGLPFTRCR